MTFEVVTEETLPAIIEQEIARSVGHWDGTLALARKLELDYYNAKPFGNETEGESQVISTDVADTIEGMLPEILEIFTASDDAVRFDPEGPEDEEQAKQMTEVANYVFYRQNNGFLVLYEWFKDAMIQKNGVVKYWWEDKFETTKESYQGLTENEYQGLLQDPAVKAEILEKKSYDDPQALAQLQAMKDHVMAQAPPGPGNKAAAKQVLSQFDSIPVPQLYDCTVRFTRDISKICIQAIPPEEFGISAKHMSVSIQDAPFCYHRSKKTISELRTMGCPEDILEELKPTNEPDITPESLARDRFLDMAWRDDSSPDDTTAEIWVVECFMRIDFDGDDIAELRHIIMPGRRIWINEETDHINFAALTPIIMPHRWTGKSVSEMVMDIQFTKSTLIRQMLNNLYLTNNPRKAVLSTAGGIVQANLDDLLVSRSGAIMREYVPNAIRNEEIPFVAGAAFPMIEYLDATKEARTGQTRYNQGTDADSLNKMLDIHTEIPLADGSFKILRDVVAGDVLIGSDGKSVTVLKAHEIQNPVRAYRMEFASGDQVFSGGEHLWTVMTERDKLAGVRRIINTDAVYARKQAFAENLYIPRLQRPQFGGGELPVDPYLLGCWLGDGTSAKSAITTMDQEIVDAFVADGWRMYQDRTQNSGQAITWCIGSNVAALRQDGTSGRLIATGAAWLTKMTLLGVARNKHIPQIYFMASYEDRLQLLRGLMDTDGCHHSRALTVFSQKDGRLLTDAIRLIEGLGGWPRLSEVDPGETGKEGQTYWNVTFHLFDNPFRLSRKADKWIAPERNAKTQPIIAVEPAPLRPMRCLTVDAHDGLFCVGRRFTLTHNTARGIALIQGAGQKRLRLIARIFAETGVKDLFKGIVYMLSRYSSKAMTVKLRNKWTDIDPREWKNFFNMTVNVGLGTGNRDQQLAHLSQISAEHVELMQSGRGYMVSDENIYNLYAKKAEALGFKHPELFISDPSTIPPQAKQPAPSPELIKIQAESASNKEKNQLAAWKEQFNADLMKAVEAIKAQALIAVAQMDNATKERIAQMNIAAQTQVDLYKHNNNLQLEAVALDSRKDQLQTAEQVLQLKKNLDSAINQEKDKALAQNDKNFNQLQSDLPKHIEKATAPIKQNLEQMSKQLRDTQGLAQQAVQIAAKPKNEKIKIGKVTTDKDGRITDAEILRGPA